MEEEFKNTYAESGVEYQKSRISPAGMANRFFSGHLMKYIKRKMEYHDFLLQKEIWKNLKGCAKVLDIGCGNGRFLMTAPKNVQAEGIEIIESEIKKCLEKGLKVKKVDIEKSAPFKKESFDGISMSHIIEHLNNSQEVLKKIKSIMKKNGKLMILTPNFSACYKKFYDDPTHKRPFTKQSLFRILYDAGFSDIKIKNDFFHANNSVFSIFVFFPKFKFMLEKIIGKIHSPHMIAVCRK